MPIVNDGGFSDKPDRFDFRSIAERDTGAKHLRFDTSDDIAHLIPELNEIEAIEIHVPHFADGRGFSQARMLRDQGFTGHLRASGYVIADQYAMARRSGFDDVKIDDELAARQPEPEWIARSNWQECDYQARLRD